MKTVNPILSNFKLATICIMIGLILSHQSRAESLLIQNVHIISAQQNTASGKPQNILIKDGTIAAIGEKNYPADKQLQGNGRFLIPGLIDSHVHLEGIPGIIPTMQPPPQNIITESYAQIPKSYLYFGFTSILDLASFNETIQEWNQQALRPDAHHCVGMPIPNGYPLAWDPENQYNSAISNFILYDQRQADVIPKQFDPQNHSAKILAKRIKDDGALCVKIFYETGFGPLKNLPVPTQAMVNAITTEAHKLGMPVFMHGNSEQAYRFGFDTDIDIIAHGMWHWNQLKLDSKNELQSFIKSALHSKIAFQPTIQVIYGEQELFNTNYFTNEQVKHAIPATLIAWYQSEPGQWMKNRMKKSMGDSNHNPLGQYKKVTDSYQLPIERVKTLTRLFAQANVPLIFGSDTPSGPFYTQFPGVNGYFEIQRWAEAGVSLSQIFNALTIENAKYIGLSDKIGSVEIGKTANLLLLNKNPLETIAAYDSIETVIMHGTAVQRDELSALNNAHHKP